MEQKYTLKNLMDKTIRVYVRDQRIIEGVLTCIDKFGNFLLSNAHEYLYTPDDNNPQDFDYNVVVVQSQNIYKYELLEDCN